MSLLKKVEFKDFETTLDEGTMNEFQNNIDESIKDQENRLVDVEKLNSFQKKMINGLKKELEEANIEGINLNIQGTAEAIASIEPLANTVQEKREGYNLNGMSDDNGAIINGVSYSISKSVLKLNGNCTASSQIPTAPFKIGTFSAGTYSLMFFINKGSMQALGTALYIIDALSGANRIASKYFYDYGYITEIILEAETELYGYVWQDANSVFTDLELGIMIASGTYVSKPAWEQYGKTPSLKIESPIKFVKDSYDIEISGKENYPLNLGNYKLAEVGEAKDHFDITYEDEDGYKRITKVDYVDEVELKILDGSEGWVLNNSYEKTNLFRFVENTKKTGLDNILCNYLPQRITGDYDTESILGDTDNNNIQIFLNNTEFKTVDDVKNGLSELSTGDNPLYVLFERAKSVVTEVTDENLIAQLENLLNAQSYFGETNITSTSTDDLEKAPLKLKVEYLKSNRIRIENLEKAILNLNVNG